MSAERKSSRGIVRLMCSALPAVFLGGCVINGAGYNPGSSRVPFNAAALQMHCTIHDCGDPNTITARHFSSLAVEAGVACVAHVLDENRVRSPSSYWAEYLDPLISVIPNAQIHLYAPRSATPDFAHTDEAWMHTATGEVRRFYAGHFPPTQLRLTLVADGASLSPPYHSVDEACEHGPVLEIVSRTARIVSRYAAARLHGDSGNHAVVAVIEIFAAEDNRAVRADNEDH